MDECSKALQKNDPGIGVRILAHEDEEIIRTAGEYLMYTPAWAAFSEEVKGFRRLFHVCNVISSLRYEGAEGIGSILFARRGHPNIEIILELTSPIIKDNYRGVRKLLEVSSEEFSLIGDTAYIYGLGRIKDYDGSQEDLFLVKFTKHYTWELLHRNQRDDLDKILMEVIYGQPRLPRPKIDKDKFSTVFKLIFPESEQNVNKLWPLIQEAANQAHGTMIVISSDALSDANHLKGESTLIKPTALTPEIMQMVTAIDGAVLIDQNAICHAIGAILDGSALKEGDPTRGARYNSAKRYVKGRNNCIAVVISEDGTVDLVHGSIDK